MALAGCSRQTKHQVLTFFFTGVPPLTEEQPNKIDDNRAEHPAKVQQDDITATSTAPPPDVKKNVTASAVLQVPRYFSHSVWLEGHCSSCHVGGRSFGFQSGNVSAKNSASKVFYSGGGMPGPLKQPKEKICLTCHTDKTGMRAINDKLWLHNTTAKGECLACHDAHQGRYPGILRLSPDTLCQSCHTEEKIEAVPMHRSGNEPCLSCHNPHMGKDRRLLSRDYHESKVLVPREP
jgi:predicted CXXCH cytochrome family protein